MNFIYSIEGKEKTLSNKKERISSNKHEIYIKCIEKEWLFNILPPFLL